MSSAAPIAGRRWLFLTCFVALVTTAFAFLTRIFVIDAWAADFGFDKVQAGQLLGAGLWPFAVSIVLFSLVIDRFGYGRALAVAFAFHVISVGVTLCAPLMMAEPGAGAEAVLTAKERGFQILYWGSVVAGLAAGTVEAVINPVIATAYAHNKAKWLTILHAGWAGGIVLAALLLLAVQPGTGLLAGLFNGPVTWPWQVALLLVPTLIYGAMALRCRFPVNERVAAGVSYREMLSEVGGLGAFIAVGLVAWELARVFGPAVGLGGLELGGLPGTAVAGLGLGVLAGLGFLVYTGSLGRPLFVFLLLVMVLLATTELGTDSWIKDLMKEPMRAAFGLDSGWVLVFSASVMLLLRVGSGPLVRLLNPVGLLLLSCVFVAAGMVTLSKVSAASAILIGASLYAIGQAYFWPMTLGLVSERFPKGGALTLNAIAGVGLIGVGILGNPLLGYIQDREVETGLVALSSEVADGVLSEPKPYVLGEYRSVDPEKLKLTDDRTGAMVSAVQADAKRGVLLKVAALPLTMLVCYVGLWLYFRANGGYRAESLPVTRDETPRDYRPV